RQEAEGSGRRVPHRPQAPPQGRHARAGGEVQDQPRPPLPREAAGGDPRPVPRPEAPRSDAGARVRRSPRHLAVRSKHPEVSMNRNLALAVTTAALLAGGCATTYDITL